MSRDPRLSAIVPVYNKAFCLRASLDSVVAAAAHAGDVELLFVDHHSTDGSYEIMCEYGAVARLSRHHGGTVAEVRNVAAREAAGDVLCFIDCDCVVDVDYFDAVRRVLAETGAAAVGCEYDLPSPAHWTEAAWFRLHYVGRDGDRLYLNAGNFAVRRAAFEQVGGFDAAMETGEDYDIGRRMTAAGLRTYEAAAVRAVHLGNPKSVRAFFRKQLWHGRGHVDARGRLTLNVVSAMTLGHVLALAVALALLVAPVGDLGPRTLVALGLAAAMPATAVAFRMRRVRRWSNPLPGIVLYFVYFLARARAIATGLRAARPTRLSTAPAGPRS